MGKQRRSSLASVIPIADAERISKQRSCPMVVIFAIHADCENFTVTTYGETKKLCRLAAMYGDEIAKRVLNGEMSGAVQKERLTAPEIPYVRLGTMQPAAHGGGGRT